MSYSLDDAHCQIEDSRGNIVFSNLPRECLSCAEQCRVSSEVTQHCGQPGRRRRGKITVTEGSAFLCTTDGDLINSSRLFQKELRLFALVSHRVGQIRDEISVQETAKARRLIHNLITLNAHSLQDLYSVIPQDELSGFSRKNFRSQRDFIQNKLVSNPRVAADLFIRALKNEGAVKNELSVFKRLYDSKSSLSLASHAIHRVVLNVANYFFQDFADKQIRISIEDCSERIKLDYESVQVALYHLFDNAAKYCAPNSDFRITFASSSDSARLCVLLDMVSYFLPDEERKSIYDDGFSGRTPREQESAGQGMGMGLVRELLKLNGAEVDAQWGRLQVPVNTSLDSGVIYAHNTLIVRFRR